MTADVARRLQEHNSGKSRSTKYFIPWKLIYVEACAHIAEARQREKFLKTTRGKKSVLKNLG